MDGDGAGARAADPADADRIPDPGGRARRNARDALLTLIDALELPREARHTLCHHLLLGLVDYDSLDLWDTHQWDLYERGGELVEESVAALQELVQRQRALEQREK